MRGRELIQTVGKTMLQGGGTFGCFMGIGTGIRCWHRTGLSDGNKCFVNQEWKIGVIQTFKMTHRVYNKKE